MSISQQHFSSTLTFSSIFKQNQSQQDCQYIKEIYIMKQKELYYMTLLKHIKIQQNEWVLIFECDDDERKRREKKEKLKKNKFMCYD